MKAAELRIGNWIDLGGQRNLHRVEDEILGCLNLNPIPLTEEWLLKFGFKKVMCKDNYITYSNRNKRIGIYPDRCIMRGHAVSFKYVHQLQNLYFALTGEELILNI